jgi:HSP20 family protein
MRINTSYNTAYSNLARDFAKLAGAMNRAYERNFAPYDYASSGGNGDDGRAGDWIARLPVDIWTGDKAYTITAYVPGVKPEDVEITMDGEELAIRGRFPKVSEVVQFVTQELFHGAFERRLTFNVPVDVEKIEAVYADGLLTLTVPKAEEVLPKQIKVIAK